ncbi:LamG domain-containing protein [Marichromatium bheemlicum]|uniref:LamG domain-containing protein n=1 Tax=Marichromatium bheemlicum TaxID=365339 RepID=A0ABX1I9J9_9GAMM|nr:LamG domain-containing protein [Marichromatium bheemlicum]NKN34224.1 LamG domain-containing protein [Marichromatium bheemlicum]
MSAPTSGYNVSSGPVPGMRIPNPLPLDNEGHARPFTVEHWYRLHALPSNAGVLGTLIPGERFDAVGINLYFRAAAGVGLRLGIGASDIRVGTPVIGAWTHLAWVYDGALAETWQDGVLVGSGAVTNMDLRAAAPFWHAQFNGSEPRADCEIARLRFWDRALTGPEITAARQAEYLPFGTPGLLAEYQLDTQHPLEPPSVHAVPAQLLGNTEQTATSVSGIITDQQGAPAARTVRLYHRQSGALLAETRSSATDGAYLLTTTVPREVDRLVLSDDDGGPADPVLPDLVDRLIPG